jgi:UDP-3-O-[3-hydroxymyristoyl] glucosamine N-acyltransferase
MHQSGDPTIHPTCTIGANVKIGKDVAIGAFTVIDEGAFIGDGVTIHPLCFIGKDARLGEGSLLHPGVTILERVIVGKRVTLHSGVVIGTDGFGYAMTEEEHYKIPQVGTVVIEDGVEIGANTCIDRATTGATSVGRATRIGSLIQVGHNVRIGSGCILEAQAGLAGSCIVEDDVRIGAQTGLAGHIVIGTGTTARAQSGITKSVPPGSEICGFPARPCKEAEHIDRCLEDLPALMKKISQKAS